MLRCVTNITIEQQGTGRNKVFNFDFVNEFTANDTWVDLTNSATIKLPKNVYYKNKFGRLEPLMGTNVNIGGFDNSTPSFLKGDKISIRAGYRYFRNENEVLDMPGEGTNTKIYQFQGYITEIISKMPFELRCEDNMWLLKQTACKPRVWNGSLENLIKELISVLPQFTVNNLTQTNIGPVVVGNQSVAELLAQFRKDAGLEAYFRGNELRIGSKIYIDSEAKTHKFVFQKNIITDDLKYQRKEDIVLSAICISTNEILTGESTKDGEAKTKQDRIEVLVYWDKISKSFKYQQKQKGVDFPKNVEGERRTFNYVGITSVIDLFEKGKQQLRKYYYTGFKGNFLTFGIPFVRNGDNVIFEDAILPERNGTYKVKGVEYSGGIQGLRQNIILDYKIPITDE